MQSIVGCWLPGACGSAMVRRGVPPGKPLPLPPHTRGVMDIKSLIKERDREDEGVDVPIYPRGFEPDPEAEEQPAPITFTMLGRDATAVKDVLDRQAREWQSEVRKSKGKFPKIDPAKTYANRVDVAVAALIGWTLNDP